MKYLVTGVAGFIGMHVAKRLLERGDLVVGVDNLSDYYDTSLKSSRLNLLSNYQDFKFIQGDLVNRDLVSDLFAVEKFDGVVHLAAQAGVRYSVSNPYTYGDSNLTSFLNILECCRNAKIGHLVYASSSSVYGNNKITPFSEGDRVDHPVSLYAATKRANELMAYSYSHLYGLPATGLRFFTVYGPWGRPDQSIFLFVKAILDNQPIQIFNEGLMWRDFTYIDDIVEGVVRVLDKPAMPSADYDSKFPLPHISESPFRIFNIGNNEPVLLLDLIDIIEASLNIKAEKCFMPMQIGDVSKTLANVDALEAWVAFKPSTTIRQGINNFIDWYRTFYKV